MNQFKHLHKNIINILFQKEQRGKYDSKELKNLLEDSLIKGK